MTLFLVRHVKAGDRSRWDGPDELRPVSNKGRKQSEGLAARLRREAISTLVASPSRRCVQTLEPLAELLGMKVEEDARLFEGSPIEDALTVVEEAPDGAVLCSHGDIIPDVVAALVRRGMELTTKPDWRKATVWTLERSTAGAAGQRRFTSASVEPPPTT